MTIEIRKGRFSLELYRHLCLFYCILNKNRQVGRDVLFIKLKKV